MTDISSLDIRAFAKAGSELAELHVGYENIAPYPLNISGAEGGEGKFRVKKMKLITDGDERRIRYNEFITISGIPAEAWRYVVNGKSALEWLIERYTDETDRDSGIRSDANEWSADERYILDLIARVVYVSVETAVGERDNQRREDRRVPRLGTEGTGRAARPAADMLNAKAGRPVPRTAERRRRWYC